ncbi:uncharacterized protein LOC131432255 [Malaya genurostris]|uniref:uncharacterized protein LOC131432255 n=1 Tax=Malaya genurostris TaxID=325434 RepID=UPI0026F3DA9E|nr:uncharacterized protein LOC131432255 [Malaya genurostris]
MDKSIGKDKRRLDKRFKKPPPGKSGNKRQSHQKEVNVKTVPPTDPLYVYDDRYSKRTIEPNWNSQQELSSDSENEQSKAADFENLLHVPHSVSGHFFLSTEKHWVSEAAEPAIISGKSNQQYGNYFKIDTKHLNAGFATIPFHERNGYPADIFSEQEINSMKLKAELEKTKYKQLCSNLEASKQMSDKNTKQRPAKCLIGTDAVPPQSAQENVTPIKERPPRPSPCLIGPWALPQVQRNNPDVTASRTEANAITERLNEVKIEDASAIEESVPIRADTVVQNVANDGDKGAAAKPETKEDIQQWLDDILDM